MDRTKRTQQASLDYQKLEDKVYLTVSAAVTQTGSLSVRGVADGIVEITALGNRQFLVTDNGAPVATVAGVRQNIAVKMDPGSQNDTVRIALLDETINNVVVELSDGNNDFQITGNVPITRVVYRGGGDSDTVLTAVETQRITAVFSGDGTNQFTAQNNSLRYRYRGGMNVDSVTLGSSLAPGTFQAEFAGIILGDGRNEFDSYATITKNQNVQGGDQRDTISSFNVNGTATFRMGNGENVLFLDGNYGRLFVRGGYDSDTVFFDPNSLVGQRVGILLYGGNDFVRVDGRFNTDFYFNSTDGEDQVFFSSTTLVTGDVSILLGADSNRFTHDGETRGDLFVTSRNLTDDYRINGIVLGTIRLRPGGQ